MSAHDPNQPPLTYSRTAEHAALVADKDVRVPMRDGVELRVDVYRPKAPGGFPALLAFGNHNKDLQGLEFPRTFPSQPAGSPLWVGHLEAGDTRFFVSRGYVHVIGSARGMNQSAGVGSREWDSYDVIQWIGAQPWCDGQVGMIGVGAFAAEQFHAAKQRPPALKTLFAYDPRGAYGTLGSFREEYPGGVLHVFRYLQAHFSGAHHTQGAPGDLPAQVEQLWREAMANPDYRMYPHLFHVLSLKGQHMPRMFELLLDPYDHEEVVRQAEEAIAQIDVPVYTGAGWYGYTYKMHLCGAQNYFRLLKTPKRLVLAGPTPPARPLRALRNEMLRWYDHWLKGIDTGLLTEPAVKYWVMGENRWRCAADWPLPETVWTNLYLSSWERLSFEAFTADSLDEFVPPDVFAQMPPTQTRRIQTLRYATEPLGENLLVAGPIVLHLYASIDQDDTLWVVALKDLGVDGSERELSRGWLKASYRVLDAQRSLPYKPWHKLTREARRPVVPGEVNEYVIEILATANLFRIGHRICIEISSLDLPTGVAGATDIEYIPYHICVSKTVVHTIYHDARRPSRLVLPVAGNG